MPAVVPSLRIRPEDNVSVVLTAGGLKAGDGFDDGTRLIEDVPFGHKVALCDIPEGGAVTRYGETIGIAAAPLARGAWVNEHRIHLPQAPDLDALPPPARAGETATETAAPLDGCTFDGYRNPDGSVGTRNILAISTSVQCVAGVVDHVVDRIRAELLPRFPNVDDVVGLNHAFGCGVAINAPGAEIPIRTLQNLAKNPNFGGEIMVIGLGCEKLRPEWLRPEGDLTASVLSLQDPELVGFSAMVAAILAQAEGHLERLNRRRRETCPVSELVVGVQCGGSDAFSGVTANPVIGAAADLVVRAGGSVMFSEVTEVRDAVHLLAPRCVDDAVSAALAREMGWYDAYLSRGGADRSANTTPGNKAGGLSGIVEKALGSVIKSGTSPLADVTGPGERLRRRGLTFAATPAGDFVCGTLQLAAGMNLHIFSTGRGTPYNIPGAPTLKVATNSELARRWFDLIDLDAGRVLADGTSIEALGRELFDLMLDIASGRARTAADKLGIRNDLVLFNPAPAT